MTSVIKFNAKQYCKKKLEVRYNLYSLDYYLYQEDDYFNIEIVKYNCFKDKKAVVLPFTYDFLGDQHKVRIGYYNSKTNKVLNLKYYE